MKASKKELDLNALRKVGKGMIKKAIQWVKFNVFGIGRCKSCKGSGNGKPYGDSELLGLNAHHTCESCKGSGHEA